MDFIKNNPAIIVGLVRAVALGLTTIGIVTLTNEQEAALVVVISLIFSVISSRLTVPKVVPADAPEKSVQVVAPQ